MAYERKDYSGARAETSLSGSINNSVTSISITSATGWPDGTNGPFYAVVDPGTATEEKVLVTTRTGTTLNNVTRGADDTSAAAHDSGATIYPCFTAVDADEANYWVAELAAAVNTAGDLLLADANNSLTTVAKGSNSTVLQVSSGGTVQWGTVTSAMIADGTIVNADVNASAAIALSKLAAQNDQTVVANISGGSAVPTAVTLTDFAAALDLTNVPQGVLGYAERTSDVQPGTGTADIASVTTTVTVAADRLIKVTVYAAHVNQGSLMIRESATEVGLLSADATSGNCGGACVRILDSPSAGEHTYKGSTFGFGGANPTVEASAEHPCFILVEDIGPA